MVRYILVIAIVFMSTIAYSQSSNVMLIKGKTLTEQNSATADNSSSFYIDFKNRQIQINRLNNPSGTLPADLVVEQYDWRFNRYAAPISLAYDFTGDGVLDPFILVTGNTILQTSGARQRYATVGFIDDFGAATYFPYGSSAGIPLRTGWNSHVILDDVNGKAYLGIYDFLAPDAAIRDYLWEVDLLADPTTATQLGDYTTALSAGWARFALDGNGNFWELADNSAVTNFLIALSTDGGSTFTVVDSIGGSDAGFFGTSDSNDPLVMAAGNKISIFSDVIKSGSLAELGLNTQGTTNPDSADGVYHYYSTDGGNSWTGEWVSRDGQPVISNRPNYEQTFSSFAFGSFDVDNTGVTHLVKPGLNSFTVVGPDTVNAAPIVYWNDKNKTWISLERPNVETYPYDFNNLSVGNFNGPSLPVVKADASGNVVVAMWNLPQFSGEPGNSPINIYSAAGQADKYFYDVVYAYSTNGGAIWSAPEIATSVPNECNYWVDIAAVEVTGGSVNVHYTYFYDDIPGAGQLAENSFGTNGTWRYNIVSFPYTPVATADVTFQVDMGVQAQKGRFTIGDPVKLAGNFNGWNNGVDVMTDVDGDTIYTITKTLNVGDSLFFKFIKGVDTWENVPNREYVVPASNSTFYAYFDDDDQYATPVTIDITFACNMELEIASGRFNPTTDTLSVRGSFNGWGANDLMFQSTTDPNVYDGTFSVNTFEGETINYKFAYFGPNGTTWENDPNKTYTVTADDITFGAAFIERGFNNLDLSNVTNFPVTIKFTVNMAGAISSINLQPFPSIDDVRICGANAPLQWPAGGWPNADSIRTIKLYDNGTNGDVTAGDNVWSREVIFPQYSPLSIQYKYGANWGLASNNGGNDNENGVGADHFITLTPDLVSATVLNVFGTMGTHPLVDIVTDVNEIKDLVPVVYDLGQNYPNPFNPSTTIKFSIPESGMVTLRVFNMLGQEVATLLNSEKTAGVYEASFDASALSSGIYFYTLDSKNFTSTKKMVLLK